MTRLGRYEIVKPLGRGGTAELLLARATGMSAFERHVVIKRIRPEVAVDSRFVQMFLDEARVAASLHHQHIIQVHDVGEQDGAYFFAMEYIHGEDLRAIIAKVSERRETVPLELACQIVAAAAAGLHHAHDKLGPDRQPLGLVHRDVSPGNVLVGYDGGIKLLDFGLAKAAHRSSATTRAGALKGKAGYMSPEQCRGEPLDRRSDVFGLGILLYELLTARPLFKAMNDYMTMAAIVQSDVPPPSTVRADIPPALDEITLRALAKDPAARYQSADDVRAALERFMTDAQLRSSTKRIADTMKHLFGERPEPWLEPKAPEPEPVRAATLEGVVEPPSSPEATVVTATSPLALAHAMATGEPLQDEFADEQATILEAPRDFPGDDTHTAATKVSKPIVIGRADEELTGPLDPDALPVPAAPPRPPTASEALEDAPTMIAPPVVVVRSAPMYLGPPAPTATGARLRSLKTSPLVIATSAIVVVAIVAIAVATCGTHGPAVAPAPPDAAVDAPRASPPPPDAAAPDVPAPKKPRRFR